MTDALPREIVPQVETLGRALAELGRRNVDAPLETLEEAVLGAVRSVLPALLGAVVRMSQRSLWPGGSGPHWRCPACAGEGWVQRWQQREVLTLCGPLRYERPWCRCSRCGRGFSPTDATLGVASRQRLRAGVKERVVDLGGATSFAQGAWLLERLTGLELSAETVRHETEALGAQLEAEQGRTAEVVVQTQEAAGAVDAAPGQLVVETDGVMVRYQDGWHEVKIGVVGGYLAGKLTAKSYTAARSSPAQFGPRLLAEAARRGALDIVAWEGSPLQRRLAVLREVTVLGDGAPWIWNLAAEHFGTRVEIVDWYHASEHVWAVAKALHGEEPAASCWASARLAALWQEGVAPLQAVLAQATAPNAAAQEVLRRERGYFRTNGPRMAYPRYRAAGLPIGSGAVESSARHVVQQRLKRAGCRWSEVGAQGVLNVCCQRASTHQAAA